MNKKEYTLLKATIVKDLGQPVFEMNSPVNESAKKLVELKHRFNQEQREADKLKTILLETKSLVVPDEIVLNVPDEIIKESWLSPFNDSHKAIINQWLLNIAQSKQDVANALNIPVSAVRSLFRSDSFKALRKHLELAFKPVLPLEALSMLRSLMRSKTENVALQAAKLVLLDAGLYKGESLDITNNKPKEVLLDAETEEKLRKLGNNVMGVE